MRGFTSCTEDEAQSGSGAILLQSLNFLLSRLS